MQSEAAPPEYGVRKEGLQGVPDPWVTLVIYKDLQARSHVFQEFGLDL